MLDKESKPKTFPESEEEILNYWQKHKIFEQTLRRTHGKKPFVFYEGPPTANGKPGIHHVLARSYKDIILRFKTMQGFFVRRKAGWDTHGLPVEIEVEKQLGLKTKKDIEKYGIAEFNQKCRESVWKYKEEWDHLTGRMGFWLDLRRPYITYESSYIESLWWVFSQIAKNGYLYKDYKVLPWCPRCGTALSSHELAQGYKTVKDRSVYVRFRLKARDKEFENTSILSWTTTPWTLPGNVALAVNPKARYAILEKDGDPSTGSTSSLQAGSERERLIIAEDRLELLGEDYKKVGERNGEDLVGMEYEPLFEVTELKSDNSYKIYPADFVNTEEGTGIVHTAVMYGEDDYRLGKKVGLPTVHTVDEAGRFKDLVGKEFAGKHVKDPETEKIIIEYLRKKNLLFKEEFYEHSYPFCWRCQSALIYFAKDSWFLKTTAVKKKMLRENVRIRWHPEFIRDGRFGEWLRENVDWAISRERYWGMPLPIWVCSPPAGECGREEVIGSLEELDQKRPKDTTKVFMMRHGEAGHNVKGLVGPATVQHDTDNHLTPKGKKQVQKSAKLFKKIGADVIVSSPLNRAQETARIVSEELNIRIEVNEHIYDYDVGAFHGRSIEETAKAFPYERRFQEAFPNGESLRDVRARMMRELDLIIKKHAGKKILLISHGDPLWVLHAARSGIPEEGYQTSWYPKTAEVKELELHNWPYNKGGELDLHRPYMDAIKLSCPKCQGEMQRVREVADVWFDSGAMPFAQDHYPFEKRGIFQYPADYIVEAIDQTRGWFYTLLAVSSLLDKPAAYKNVLSLGFILDEKGEKMSKSRGNIVEPFPLFDQYGADATRWYFYTVNQPWDEKVFRKSDIADASRRFLNIFWNSFIYWETYKTGNWKLEAGSWKPKSLINKWVLARLNQVGYEVTQALEKFDVTRAARTIERFVVEDLSHWYIRRIRDAIRFGSKEEQKEISSVFGRILFDVSRLSAPFIPFLTERMYKDAKGKKQSIHLEDWPTYNRVLGATDRALIKDIDGARRIVSAALEARSRANIKVRQPLALLKIKKQISKTKNKELLDLIRGEVNVKEVVFDKSIKNEVALDTTITQELKEEGQARELIRRIQAERKKKGFEPKDKIVFVVLTDEEGKAFVKKYEKTLKKEAGIGEIVFDEKKAPKSKAKVELEFHV